jgi:cytochrome P450
MDMAPADIGSSLLGHLPEAYESLQAQSSLPTDRYGVWLGRHADCASALNATHLMSGLASTGQDRSLDALDTSDAGPGGRPRRAPGNILFSDPPHHAALRRSYREAIPTDLRRLERQIESVADELAATCARSRIVDVVGSYARPLAALATSWVLGLGTEAAPLLQQNLPSLVYQVEPLVSPRRRREASLATVALLRYFRDRLGRPEELAPDGALAALCSRGEGGSVGLRRADRAVVLAHAAFDNTANSIAASILTVSQLPFAARRITPGLVEECLRLASPARTLARRATAPLATTQGVVDAPTVVFVVLGAANRDGAEFPSPGHIDTQRPMTHLAFGAGRHRCLGSHIARLEVRVALQRWFENFPRSSEARGVEWRRTLTMTGPKTCPIELNR